MSSDAPVAGSALTLSHLTFTGADDAVDPAELVRLSAEAPLIEWAVLLSAEDEGRPRFPSPAWRKAFAHAAPPTLRSAAHVCGPGLLAEAATTGVPGPYQRMQLNFSLRTLPGPVLRAWVQASLQGLDPGREGGSPTWPRIWITQHNAENAALHERFATAATLTGDARSRPHHAVLFDASGGRRLTPPHWPPAIPGLDCGYAGGLGPDTLAQALPHIAAAAAHGGRDRAVWLDMEGGVRTDDRFDLARVRRVVEVLRACAGGAPLVPGVRLSFPAGSAADQPTRR